MKVFGEVEVKDDIPAALPPFKEPPTVTGYRNWWSDPRISVYIVTK
jgi:hypothetical protein